MGAKPTPPTTFLSGAIEDLAAYFLNAYEVANAHELRWPVRLYIVDPIDGSQPEHQSRGGIVRAMWQSWRKYRHQCRGYGFITNVDERRVAVAGSWNLPTDIKTEEYHITFQDSLTADASNLQHRAIVLGIIREATKKHFKDERSCQLGTLWQNYGNFCQMPTQEAQGRFSFCRKFRVTPVSVGKSLALRFEVTTTVLDGRTFDWYYQNGKVKTLARMITRKRQNKWTRRGDEVAVRVWCDERTDVRDAARVVELQNPDLILKHADLSPGEQAALPGETVTCCEFRKPPEEVRLDRARLVLDTQVTKEEHRETIIEPEERCSYAETLRAFLDGMDVYGKVILLRSTPLPASQFSLKSILPPAIKVRAGAGHDVVLPPPDKFTSNSLRERARSRAHHLRQHGFLRSRAINPLLALPQTCSEGRLKRMLEDTNHVMQKRGVNYRFTGVLYETVECLRRKIEQGNFDALLAVLPEKSSQPYRDGDMHNRIKRKIAIPSQCIHIDNTLPQRWVGKSSAMLKREKRPLWNALRNRYALCVDNLLVKHGWIPFIPAAPFHYNVHVGLDVGGRSNNTAFACVAHGLSHPEGELVFRLQKIPIELGKAEPIPPKSLASGLLDMFEYIAGELESLGFEASLDNTLFIRDGAVLGHGDAWNERAAFEQLHKECLDRAMISPNSIWTITEVLKRAEGWRLFSSNQTPQNPLVGFCLTDFAQPSDALLCATGRPYLTQGCAQPLKVRVSDIHGTHVLDNVLRDLVWEADMGYTKPDMGRGLPWVLHIADTGALQESRSYRISGITA